ncbi:hemolysin activation/secretion protein [Dyella japonica]|uniref:Hemolysin activation/secretion protein n=1 Tax=Dyella japonica TaxID=231455 RepID=A0ABV2K110_9GAMM
MIRTVVLQKHWMSTHPCDVLNLCDIEQPLGDLKRTPTAEAYIQIVLTRRYSHL